MTSGVTWSLTCHYDMSKHVNKRKASRSRSGWQLDGMRRQLAEELVSGDYQLVETAGQAVGGDGGLEQAPDALGRVGLVGRVGRQPERLHARMGIQPGMDDLGGGDRRVVEHQVERLGRVRGGEVL